MSQTQPNGVITITNDEVYDLSLHQARLAKSIKSVHSCANQTARDGLAALYGGTLPIPTLVYRVDLDSYQSWNGTNWGGPVQYDPIDVTGYDLLGKVTVTPDGTLKRVNVAISVVRTSASAAAITAASFAPFGQVLPSQAVGTAEQMYLPVSISGGIHVHATVFLKPVDGTMSIRGLADFSWPQNALFSLNCTYYI
jgi:hypothetical protein